MSDVGKSVASGVQTKGLSERTLPKQIDIPAINGEMVHLRPATIDDLRHMDELQAFYNSTGITGKGPEAERAVVNAWVRRSVSWSRGESSSESGVGDAESRPTIAWAMISRADHDKDGLTDAGQTDGLIGMIFLINIDGWSRSARIQVVLGKDYRGRGYSRDAMPRVMTYGYATAPSGLGLHRIWVAVPEKNTRSISVYQSLGFVVSGTARDALWDEENRKYQDQLIMDTLADEYDPIQSLDAFDMHVLEDNPGVSEALKHHKHPKPFSRQEVVSSEESDSGQKLQGSGKRAQNSQTVGITGEYIMDNPQASTALGGAADNELTQSVQKPSDHTAMEGAEQIDETASSEDMLETSSADSATKWAYSDSSQQQGSKRAWWRNLGHGNKRNSGGNS